MSLLSVGEGDENASSIESDDNDDVIDWNYFKLHQYDTVRKTEILMPFLFFLFS